MKTKMLIVASALLLSTGAGTAYATEPGPHAHCLIDTTVCVQAEDGSWVDPSYYAEIPTTQCGDVVDGFEVGARADLCPDTTTPVPYIPPMTADDVVGSYPAPAPVITPEEDEPGWDCETMGNLTCGVPVEAATPVYAPDAATSERVTAGEELAYTGANTGALAVAGGAMLGLGTLAVRYSRRTA